MLDHILLGAEDERAGGTSLDAGGLETHCHAIGAQRAFVCFVLAPGDPGYVEWATRDAIAAADTVLFLEIDDPVRVLNDCARRRTRLEAPRVLAVHAAVLADQPLEVAARVLVFGEAHDGPGLIREIGRIIV